MNKTNKLVSVIIPFYNRLDLLSSSMKSVLDQTYRPIELILIDDFYEDKFDRSFIDKYSGEGFKIKIERNERNIGPGLSREVGRLMAKGDYFAYLDSDDFWHKEFLDKLITYIEKNPQAGMAYSKTLLLRNTGNFLRNKNDKTFNNIIPVIFDKHGRPWATGACVWRREIVNKIGSWSSARIWEDYEYDVRAAIINNNINLVMNIINQDKQRKIDMKNITYLYKNYITLEMLYILSNYYDIDSKYIIYYLKIEPERKYKLLIKYGFDEMRLLMLYKAPGILHKYKKELYDKNEYYRYYIDNRHDIVSH
ncbi:MAG TPA: glycosyltransferase family 2 protein, partial [Ignavibacteria bacterium]|nr:glycosyltransferase family 2 protein [Ignavibacteria bacterium]